MMKYLTILGSLFFLVSGCILYNQSTIRGEVKNKDGIPVQYIQILLKEDNSTINGAYTDSLGIYKIFGVKAGMYDIILGGTNRCINTYTEKDVVVLTSEMKLINFTIDCVTAESGEGYFKSDSTKLKKKHQKFWKMSD